MKFEKETKYSENIINALKNGNEEETKKAINEFQDAIVEKLKIDYEEFKATQDKKILAERGYRNLTSKEVKFYQGLAEAVRSSNPKQALTDLLTTDDGMPETIIIDVYKNVTEEHPLIKRINFHDVKYITKWLLTKHNKNQAIWGKITDEIKKQLDSSFKEIDVDLGKLSAFVLISLGMLDLGPVFLDNYIRTILKESIACGLEYGIIKGKGVNDEPIGLIRDVSEGVSISSTEGYPEKTKIKVKNFETKEYCNLIANNLIKREDGTTKTIDMVSLIVNPIDYLKKVLPATTVRNFDGKYINDLFPFPTEVIKSSVLDEGESVLAILPEYFFGIGNNKEGVIEYSDEYKFLEDARTYKIKLYGYGQAEDNTTAAYLDISELEPAYITVNNITSSGADKNNNVSENQNNGNNETDPEA